MIHEQPISFKDTSRNNLLQSSYTVNPTIPKLLNCPYCGVIGNHNKLGAREYQFDTDRFFLVSHWKCTHCEKSHVQYVDENLQEKNATFIASYPGISITFFGETFKNVSPRFQDYLSQALFCDYHNHYDLAAIGLRSALEILCKDFALKYCEAPEKIKNDKLVDVIHNYFKEAELNNTANIIRILGNDYTHYERKYSEEDYRLLKKCFVSFLNILSYRYLALTAELPSAQNP